MTCGPDTQAADTAAGRKASGWRTAVSAALLAFCGPLAAGTPAVLEAVTDSGTVLVQRTIPPGGRWCLAWNHSVAGFAVRDCYRHVEGRMVLERSHQPDFAAGLGHIPGRGRQHSDGRGGYWIEDIDEPVPGNAYALRVGSAAVDHRLVIRGTTFSLSDAAAGERVRIRLSETAASGDGDSATR